MFGEPAGPQPIPGVQQPVTPVRRPRRWSLSNWPVRYKVLAIALIPLLLAAVFGGLRVYASTVQARALLVAADRVELLPVINDYMAGLENALVATATGGDTAAAETQYNDARSALQQRLGPAAPIPEVRLAVTTLLDNGGVLLDKARTGEANLRQQVTTYAPLLLTAETAITGSVRVDDEDLRAQADGLARAVGARGQMTMQRMLVERGADLPEPELRASMVALAGTEPSTVMGMSALLGGVSEQANELRSQMVQRISLISDPAAVLVGNPELLASIQITDDIARQLVAKTTTAITSSVHAEAAHQRNNAIRDGVVVLVVFLLVLAIVALVARSLIRPLRRLRDGALKIAHQDLAAEIDRVKAGDEREPAPLPIHTSEEVGQVAHAVDELHAQALLLAGDEARLRVMVNDMFETMSRRNKSLVDQQLSLIDALERNEEDPGRLDSLFRLDHLATRMRRNGANLLVLAGAQTSRDDSAPVALGALINAAASEVEDYRRVEVSAVPDCSVTGAAAADAVHMLAELLDNALQYSPPTVAVRVRASYTSNGGVLIDIDDAGLGMTDGDLRIANMRLTAGGEVSPESARHMGLFVVGRLARRHDMTVRLLVGADGAGTTAQAYLPPELLDGAVPAPAPAPPAAALAPPQPVWGGGEPDPIADQADDAELTEASVTLLPRREPGSSGIAGDGPFGGPDQPADEPWWERESEPPAATVPADTSGFFGSRRRREDEPAEGISPQHDDEPDLIYQNMVSEWLVDPQGLATPQDWKSVWDNGWTAAAEAERKPVSAHTDNGLPVRDPGARLVPGAAAADRENAVASDDGTHPDQGERVAFDRDPEAIRASISSHFGGVHAGRSQDHDTSRGRQE